MDTIRGVLGVMQMSFDLPIKIWPVTLSLLALASWSIYKLVNLRRYLSVGSSILILSSCLVFIAVPFYALAFWANPTVDTPETQKLPSDVLGIVFWGYLALVVIAIIMARDYRIPLAGLAACLIWINCGIFLVSIMAVSGVWL